VLLAFVNASVRLLSHQKATSGSLPFVTISVVMA
jgi:hypothetical protein